VAWDTLFVAAAQQLFEMVYAPASWGNRRQQILSRRDWPALKQQRKVNW
jgi:hypothetical protein